MKAKVTICETQGLAKPNCPEDNVFLCRATLRNTDQSFETETQPASADPNWDHVFTFTLPAASEIVDVTVCEKSGSDENTVGSFEVDLSKVEPNEPVDGWREIAGTNGAKAHVKVQLAIEDKPERERTEFRDPVKTKEERNREKAALIGMNYEEVYARSREVAEKLYEQVINRSARVLIENETIVHGE